MDQKKLTEILTENLGRPMTERQKEEQRRSFVYGNTKIENKAITRDTVDQAADRLTASDPKPSE